MRIKLSVQEKPVERQMMFISKDGLIDSGFWIKKEDPSFEEIRRGRLFDIMRICF